MVSSCVDALAFRNAVLVDARILNIEVVPLNEAPDAVYVTYSYDYAGHHFEHRTQRVATFSQSSKWHDGLSEAYRNQSTVGCYVDPENPSRSVFSREFSISLFLVVSIFPVVFGCIAVIMTTHLVRCCWQHVRDRKSA